MREAAIKPRTCRERIATAPFQRCRVNVIDEAPQLLRASDDTSRTETVVGSQRARRERIGRRWLVATAAVTVVILVAGTALLTEPGDGGEPQRSVSSTLGQTAPPTVPTT